jgi:hypothetical protein
VAGIHRNSVRPVRSEFRSFDEAEPRTKFGSFAEDESRKNLDEKLERNRASDYKM